MRKGQHKELPKERKCRLCKEVKSIDCFGLSRGHSLGYNHACKECRRKNALKTNIKRYGISIEEFEDILSNQGGGCGICGQKESVSFDGKKTRLSVDHNHSSGGIRGVLCRKCNAAIGLLNDDAELVQRAADYIRDHR